LVLNPQGVGVAVAVGIAVGVDAERIPPIEVISDSIPEIVPQPAKPVTDIAARRNDRAKHDTAPIMARSIFIGCLWIFLVKDRFSDYGIVRDDIVNIKRISPTPIL
jgi:hypothetical protein